MPVLIQTRINRTGPVRKRQDKRAIRRDYRVSPYQTRRAWKRRPIRKCPKSRRARFRRTISLLNTWSGIARDPFPYLGVALRNENQERTTRDCLSRIATA